MTITYILTAFVAGIIFGRALSALHRALDRQDAQRSPVAQARYWADMQKQIQDAPELPVAWYLREVR